MPHPVKQLSLLLFVGLALDGAQAGRALATATDAAEGTLEDGWARGFMRHLQASPAHASPSPHASPPPTPSPTSSCKGTWVTTDRQLTVRQAGDNYGAISQGIMKANPQYTSEAQQVPAGTKLCIPYGGGITFDSVQPMKQQINTEVAAALSSDQAFEAYFSQWAATFGKTYASEEERKRRMQVFRDNILRMQHKNADANATYWMQPGPDADLTDEEFAHKGSDSGSGSGGSGSTTDSTSSGGGRQYAG
ncbi:hypothetical protein N2152v2_003434 [Parachlorella kessleri]